MSERKRNTAAMLLSALCAVLALLVATTSSPLYATNFWTDTNLYFTIGRGMTEGLMPYRDLFDHKGPVLFILYALGALISDTSFFGVFLLEAASFAAALYLAWKTVELYGRGDLTLLTVPLTAMITVCTVAFNQGGSAEEFCLPALALGLYAVLRCMREGDACTCVRALMIAFGAAMGWVFAVKYTDCGLFFGLAFAVLLYEWRVSGFARAFVCGLYMLAGMALVVLPSAAYLAANGALGACIDVYFIQNIFGYGESQMSLADHVYNALAYLRTQSMANPLVAVLAMAGCALSALWALIVRKKGFIFEMIAAPLGAGLLLLFCYWGEMAHPYYALVFAALSPLGLIPLAWLAPRAGKKASMLLCAAAAALIVPVSLKCCLAVPLMDVMREDMAQVKLAAVMQAETQGDEITLLDLTSLDQGFYLAAGIVPNCRYFANNNLNTVEKREAINGYLAEGRTEFVVSRWSDPGENYELIAEASGVFDLSDMRDYKLYRLEEKGSRRWIR